VTFSALLDGTFSGTSVTTKAEADPVINDDSWQASKRHSSPVSTPTKISSAPPSAAI
jgi:hypothetical protein